MMESTSDYDHDYTEIGAGQQDVPQADNLSMLTRSQRNATAMSHAKNQKLKMHAQLSANYNSDSQ